jgi:predicted metalloendopeptidase
MLYLTSVTDMDSTNTGLQSDKSFIPEDVCSLLSFNYFDKVISKYMIPAFIKKTSRARIEMMVESLKKAFEKRMQALSWLDGQTKEQALKKVCF